MEEWAGVEGFPEYQISSQGRLRSYKLKERGVIVKGWIEQDGYRRHILKSKGVTKYITAHRLVALHHLDSPNEGESQVNHIDGDRLNNNVENLEWCSPQYNVSHSISHGVRNSAGEGNPKSVLTEVDVRRIRDSFASKESTPLELSKEYGVTRTSIYNILNNKTWKEVI